MTSGHDPAREREVIGSSFENVSLGLDPMNAIVIESRPLAERD
jgi:hypothetical protein